MESAVAAPALNETVIMEAPTEVASAEAPDARAEPVAAPVEAGSTPASETFAVSTPEAPVAAEPTITETIEVIPVEPVAEATADAIVEAVRADAPVTAREAAPMPVAEAAAVIETTSLAGATAAETLAVVAEATAPIADSAPIPEPAANTATAETMPATARPEPQAISPMEARNQPATVLRTETARAMPLAAGESVSLRTALDEPRTADLPETQPLQEIVPTAVAQEAVVAETADAPAYEMPVTFDDYVAPEPVAQPILKPAAADSHTAERDRRRDHTLDVLCTSRRRLGNRRRHLGRKAPFGPPPPS
jgi:flagellar hook-length control protein FliK